MVTSRSVVGVLVAAAIALLPLCAAGQSTSASSAATASKTYSLSPDWSAIRQIDIIRNTQVESVRESQLAPTAKKFSQEIALSTVIDFSFKVDRADGKTILEGPAKRVRAYGDAKFGGNEKDPAFDTDRPQPQPKKFSYEEMVMLLAGQKFKLTLDGKQRLEAIEGTEAYARRWVKQVLGGENEESTRSRREQLDKTFPRLVLEAFSYLPEKPQAVGDAWQIKHDVRNFEMAGGMDGTVITECTEEVECKLKEIDRVDGHDVAVIEISGHWLSTEDGLRIEGQPGLPRTKIPHKGELRFDLSSRRVISYKAVTDGQANVYSSVIMSSLPKPEKPIGINRVKYAVSMEFQYNSGVLASTQTSKPKP